MTAITDTLSKRTQTRGKGTPSFLHRNGHKRALLPAKQTRTRGQEGTTLLRRNGFAKEPHPSVKSQTSMRDKGVGGDQGCAAFGVGRKRGGSPLP
jgi:hypothetical protein